MHPLVAGSLLLEELHSQHTLNQTSPSALHPKLSAPPDILIKLSGAILPDGYIHNLQMVFVFLFPCLHIWKLAPSKDLLTQSFPVISIPNLLLYLSLLSVESFEAVSSVDAWSQRQLYWMWSQQGKTIPVSLGKVPKQISHFRKGQFK